jgi:hypothetical protein
MSAAEHQPARLQAVMAHGANKDGECDLSVGDFREGLRPRLPGASPHSLHRTLLVAGASGQREQVITVTAPAR